MDRLRDLPKQVWWMLLTSLTAAVIVFGPSVPYSFVNYDDPDILQKNQDVLNFDVKTILTAPSAYDYVPLTLLTFAVENKAFGLNPTVFRINNLILHLLNIVLLAFFLYQLFPGSPIIVGFTLFLFAVHPLQVESVAWITQRKNVLYVFFFLLGLLAYLDRRRVWSFCFFVLSLFAKATAVTFPFVLLLIDYLRNGKITARHIKEKIPFFVAAIAKAIIHLTMHGTDVHLKKQQTLGDITYNFFSSVVFYVSKIIAPFHLAPYYEAKAFFFRPYELILFVLFCGSVVWFLLKNKSERRLTLFALGLFIITLGPTLNLVRFGNYFLYADRYVYFPIIGLGIFLGLILDTVEKHNLKQWGYVGLFALCGGMVSLSLERQNIWQNSVTLWESQLQEYPDTKLAYFNLGGAYLFERQEAAKSIPYYQKALELDSGYAEAMFNWGLALNTLGNEAEALKKFESVVAMAQVGQAYLNIGVLQQRAGNLEAAIEAFKKGVALKPELVKGWELLAEVYQAKGMKAEADEALQKAQNLR